MKIIIACMQLILIISLFGCAYARDYGYMIRLYAVYDAWYAFPLKADDIKNKSDIFIDIKNIVWGNMLDDIKCTLEYSERVKTKTNVTPDARVVVDIYKGNNILLTYVYAFDGNIYVNDTIVQDPPKCYKNIISNYIPRDQYTYINK